MVGPTYRYADRPVRVTFLARPNRYLAQVRLPNDEVALAHVPNPGRMEELLVSGLTEGYAIPAGHEGRRTCLDLVAVRVGPTLVSIDSRVANPLVRSALAMGKVPPLPTGPWRAEPRWGEGRLDFASFERAGRSPGWLVEVKSSNLRVGQYSLFPDAPTVRGTRHVLALRDAARRGIRAAVIFALQRDDTERFTPNGALDPDFARALRSASRSGVHLLAHRLRVRSDHVEWGARVPVEVESPFARLASVSKKSIYAQGSMTMG
ncbi:MAG: DNA/RNA nuclease SfsA [Thermoplasmata archaeon]